MSNLYGGDGHRKVNSEIGGHKIVPDRDPNAGLAASYSHQSNPQFVREKLTPLGLTPAHTISHWPASHLGCSGNPTVSLTHK